MKTLKTRHGTCIILLIPLSLLRITSVTQFSFDNLVSRLIPRTHHVNEKRSIYIVNTRIQRLGFPCAAYGFNLLFTFRKTTKSSHCEQAKHFVFISLSLLGALIRDELSLYHHPASISGVPEEGIVLSSY